jgi:hypothetical protein
MWTYLAGPFLAPLPLRWRNAFSRLAICWTRATILSGAAESLLAFFALVYWYSWSVTHWVEHSIIATVEAHPEAAIPENTVGFAGLVLVAIHPLTWLIVWFAVEGVVRLLAAAFTATILGTFPLYALDRLLDLRPGRRSASANLPDEIFRSTDGADEILEIHSCRLKKEWSPPRVVRYRQTYYRLEGASIAHSSRPFRFTLRRLSAGVPSRSVLDYSSDSDPMAP